MPLWRTPDGMPPDVMVLGLHPGDSRIHHIATLKYGTTKGDFTPENVDQTAEVKVTVFGQFREQLFSVLGLERPGHLQARLPAARQDHPYRTFERSPELEAG
jgi:hypothetical protein